MIDLIKLKSRIEKMEKTEITELFKIIHNNKIKYSKNNNGIFINLNWLDYDTIVKVSNYINFCIKSHNEINKYEVICNMLNDSINNKDKNEEIIVDTSNDYKILAINKQKVSSSMKFYLLKKKFQKQQLTSNIESYLTYDEYLF